MSEFLHFVLQVVSGSLDHAVTTAKWFLMPDVKGPGAPKPVDTTG